MRSNTAPAGWHAANGCAPSRGSRLIVANDLALDEADIRQIDLPAQAGVLVEDSLQFGDWPGEACQRAGNRWPAGSVIASVTRGVRNFSQHFH